MFFSSSCVHVYLFVCVYKRVCVWERERERNMIIAHCFVSCFVGVHVTSCPSQVSNWHSSLTWWSCKGVKWRKVADLFCCCTLGRSPTSSNAKDYFTGYARFHGNSIIFWIKSGWKGSSDSIHLRKTLALFCMQSRLFATRSYEIRYGRPFPANMRNVGKYQNGTSYTRVSARHNSDARAPLWVNFSKGF